MENPYSVAPLNFGAPEFRLVELEPGAQSGDIKCRLRSYSLDEDYPPYVALSYAWGRKDRYKDIDLNGIRFPVGNNLWWFLHHMQLRGQYITFWIDAMCINQLDVLEQNHQVQMMRQIYSNAKSVSVWLGEADESAYSNIAMQYLAARRPREAENFNFSKLWGQRTAKGVLALCERNYWRRIWIVQEIMLAKEISIYCGTQVISWHAFERIFNDLQVISARGREKHTPCVSSVLASPAFVVVKAKSTWDGDNGNLQPLTTLLQLYRDHEATNIRDKVYALHGLAKDCSDIAIDYRTSTKNLLIQVLNHTCASRGSRTDAEWTMKELVRFGKLVAEMLRVHCPDEEIKFHISAAKHRAHDPADSLNTEEDLVPISATEHRAYAPATNLHTAADLAPIFTYAAENRMRSLDAEHIRYVNANETTIEPATVQAHVEDIYTPSDRLERRRLSKSNRAPHRRQAPHPGGYPCKKEGCERTFDRACELK
jgi:hypothetical protein